MGYETGMYACIQMYYTIVEKTEVVQIPYKGTIPRSCIVCLAPPNDQQKYNNLRKISTDVLNRIM